MTGWDRDGVSVWGWQFTGSSGYMHRVTRNYLRIWWMCAHLPVLNGDRDLHNAKC